MLLFYLFKFSLYDSILFIIKFIFFPFLILSILFILNKGISSDLNKGISSDLNKGILLNVFDKYQTFFTIALIFSSFTVFVKPIIFKLKLIL